MVVAAACLVSAPSALAAPSLAAVPGSPFPSGSGTVAVSFSPSGGLVAASNFYSNDFSVHTVDPSGVLTPAPGSPTLTGGAKVRDIAFSPLGTILAVANQISATVDTYSVASNGAVAPIDSQPVPEALRVGFSPDGGFLAVSSTDGNARVYVFSVSATGALTPVPGSPFVTDQGTRPAPVEYSPDGEFLAVGDYATNKLSVYAVAADGSLTLVGTYDSGPGGVDSIAWNPSGTRLATADLGVGVTMFSANSAGALTLLGTYERAGARAVDFNSNGTQLTTPSNTGVFVDSVSPSGVLTGLEGSPFGTASAVDGKFSPNDELIATADFDAGGVGMFRFETSAPTCEVTAVRWGLRTEVDVTVTDTGSGLASITNVHTLNATVHVPPFTPGTTTPVVVTVKKFLPILPMSWSFDATDVAGNTRHCKP